MTHLDIANGSAMAILCGITILIVLLQPVLFIIAAVRRAKELNMPKEELKEAAVSSAVFSVIPSLPIIISYLILVPSLGRYFPWLRLSVVGSAVYETMAANMAAEAFGLESITVPNIPADVFVCIVFVVTVGILGGNIFNVLFLKTYDKRVEAIKGKNAMPPQGGGDFNDDEITRAVAYMANAGGAKFTPPAPKAAASGADAASGGASAP